MLGLKKGMLGKCVWNTEGNIKKGEGKNNKDRTNKKNPKRVDGQRKRKDGTLKGKTKGKKRKQKKNRKKRNILKRGPLGEQKRKKTLKLQENIVFFTPKKKTKQNKNTLPQKTKNTFFSRVDTQPPIFGKFLFLTYTRLFLQKLRVADWQHYKKCFQQNSAFVYHR